MTWRETESSIRPPRKSAQLVALWTILILSCVYSAIHVNAQESESIVEQSVTTDSNTITTVPPTEPAPASDVSVAEESTVTPEQRQAWLDDWNEYWLNYEPPNPTAAKAAGGPTIPPDQAMFDEMAAAVAAENDPNAIHRKIYAHFLDDPKNQKIFLFCAVCTILIIIGIRLIIRRRMERRRQQNSSIDNRNHPLGKRRKHS